MSLDVSFASGSNSCAFIDSDAERICVMARLNLVGAKADRLFDGFELFLGKFVDRELLVRLF